jgi:ribosomal protein S18 acetylase RimI-like enzyme
MIRVATEHDAQELLELCNSHELRVDPDFEPMPLSEITTFLKGYEEPAHTLVLEDGGIKAVMFIQTSTPRNQVNPDLFTVGTKAQTKELFDAGFEWLSQNRKGFDVRTYCNKMDTELLALFEESGLSFRRDYFKMVKDPIEQGFPQLPQEITIEAVDLEGESRTLHMLETESFSAHFGYIPLSHDDWLAEKTAEPTLDRKGVFIAKVNGEPAGLLISDDGRSDVSGGWVDKLGVLEKFRGLGIGKLLLQWGIAHAAEKGYKTVGLGVDTGNESGALALYENQGFRPTVVWRGYATTI